MDIELSQIDLAVHQIAGELGLEVREVVGQIGLELWADATQLSPVLSGRYRSAWTLNERLPSLSVPAPGPQPPPTAPSLSLSDPFPVLVLANALPYAVRIEEGSSKKAPRGVLKLALLSRGYL